MEERQTQIIEQAISSIVLLKLLSWLKSSYGHQRCVTPLYRIPLWIFNYVLANSFMHRTLI